MSVCLTTFTVFAACKPNPVQMTGVVTATFLELSGSKARFDLANGTSQLIIFLGSRESKSEPDPSNSFITCESSVGMTRYSHVIDIPAPKEERIKVPAGERIKLVANIRVGLESRGNHCVFSMRLSDGKMVESSPFVP